MREVKAYRCDHCSFTRLTKPSVKRHEPTCFYNEATRSCATCGHFINTSEFVCYIEKSDKLTTNCESWISPDDIDQDDRNGYLDARSHLLGCPF